MHSWRNWVSELLHWQLKARALPYLLRPVSQPGECVQVGGWIVPRNLKRGAVVYSAGVGEDLNFEFALVSRFGAQVWAFDPTPRAIAFVEAIAPDSNNFQFQPVGWWSESTRLFFELPRNEDHVSASVIGADRSRPGFEAEVERLSALCDRLGHRPPDVVKMNIEGAEDVVLQTMLEDELFPDVLVLTYEAPSPLSEARRWTQELAGRGYRLLAVVGWACTYVRDRH